MKKPRDYTEAVRHLGREYRRVAIANKIEHALTVRGVEAAWRAIEKDHREFSGLRSEFIREVSR